MTLFDKQGEYEEQGSSAAENCATAHLYKHAHHNIPLFQYDPPKIGQRSHGVISVANVIFHYIISMQDFYTALGFDKSKKNKELCAEEFIWEQYRRENAKMSKHCLQIQIQIYLYNNSSKFRELYGQAYNELIGNCRSNNVDANDQHCANCPMRQNSVNSVVFH